MEPNRRNMDRSIRSGVVSAVVIGLVGAALAGPARAHEAHGHPAKLHEGTCAALGGVAFSLIGVGGTVDLDGSPVAATESVNPDRAFEVLRSETPLDASLDDLLAVPHALMVYESDEDLTAIACGDLGGNRLGDELAVGLAGVGESGHTGIALFEGDGDTTTARIFLGDDLAAIGGSGSDDDHSHEEDENHDDDEDHDDDHDEDHDDDEATPEVGA